MGITTADVTGTEGAAGAVAPGTTETPAAAASEFKSEDSKQRVLADLAQERDRRQALEAKLAELERANETEVQRQIREAREARLAKTEGTKEDLAEAGVKASRKAAKSTKGPTLNEMILSIICKV